MIHHIDKSSFDIHLVCLLDSGWLKEVSKDFNCKVTALHYDMSNHKRPVNLLSVLKLVRVIRSSQPDIVVTFFKTSYIIGPPAARIAGVRNIISTRRDYGLWLDNWSILPIRLANQFVERIVTNSTAVAEIVAKFEKFDTGRIDVIYNGIDMDRPAPSVEETCRLKKEIGIPENASVVGIIAGLKPMKHHEAFLRAADRINRLRSDIHFVIVGDGPCRSRLVSLSETLNLSGRVHFVGNQKDVLPFLKIFHVGVNCSSKEGLSNAIMEYMAYGVPCIVSRAGGNAELVKDGFNGYTFDLDDDKQLADRILRLLEDSKTRAKFGFESRKRIETTMSTNKMIENYETYFRKLVYQNS